MQSALTLENHVNVKVCPLCNRTFGATVDVCEHDGQRLVRVRRDDSTDGAPVIDWEGPLAGDVIGSYRLESMIAEGGMGRIFRATHLTLGRRVAIKFLLPEHAARADLVQRFFNEARSVNAIQHPHILEIYDFVQERATEGPSQVYMLMEHLQGEDLRVRLARERRLAPESVVHVGAQVAEALGAAHEAGILHRDLKPDNIYLCEQPLDFVKLLDFGAAKAFGDRPGADLTRPGVAIGTPEYMAPEQILAREVDGRVDAYALGIVLYELLTGEVPFTAKNTAGVLAMHSKQQPAPMARRGVDIPPALEAVVQRCLAKKPADRYPDLWAVGTALKQALAPQPGLAWPAPGAGEPTQGHPPDSTPTGQEQAGASRDRDEGDDEDGMPTLDRRFGKQAAKMLDTPAPMAETPTPAPAPADDAPVAAKPRDPATAARAERASAPAHAVQRAQRREEAAAETPRAAPREPARAQADQEAAHPTAEVEALSPPGADLLGLLSTDRSSAGKLPGCVDDDDDDDELIADLAPRPRGPQFSKLLYVVVVLVLAIGAAVAAVLLT